MLGDVKRSGVATAIELYELKNVDSFRLGALLNQLYEQVLGPRIGTVSITPLGKPNALLIIGRAENVKLAMDLVKRLDQPVSPMGRFEVFTLQNADAGEAKTIIDGFLGQGEDQPEQPATEGTDGQPIRTLAPRALVVADVRTNSLIVTATKFIAGEPMNPATNLVAGPAYTSAGVPICSMRPAFITTIREARVIASTWSWVT